MRKLLILTVATLMTGVAIAQKGYVPSAENIESRQRFEDDKFGVFIHWGVYSMLADGEWAMNVKNINHDEYARLASGFYPSKFNAAEWVSAIKASGAKYITITSRHHDGFSMFATKASPYNIVDGSPFGRDILKELADECHKQGIKLGFYYSHLDWGRDDYAPLGRTGHGTGRKSDGKWEYYQAFMSSQLTELLTNYGTVNDIWFDGVWDKDSATREEQPQIWGLYEQYALIHRLQPACLVGNNHHLFPFEGEDIQIFERDIPGQNSAGLSGQQIGRLPLETCETMNGSWGYRITDTNYKSVDRIITYLVNTAGKGANLLLNVGPLPDGTLPVQAVERLKKVGEWLARYGQTIYGTRGGVVEPQQWGVTTQKANKLYVHILDPIHTGGMLLLPYNGNKLLSAVGFDNGEKVESVQDKRGGITLMIDQNITPSPDYIIELTFKEPIE